MRYLNKIIFINSAHIPYAEVGLDGNVHFIGTQGVGKSTLLRSILFFYNADKSRLGIRTQDKQQDYDDFYLPYSNSYIVYEVVRENGKFFVVTFRSQGRTAYRFVDCEYDRRYFIDPSGLAREEWGKISEAVGPKIFKSRIIRHYEEFRDIIYGNRNSAGVDHNLRRFCIMESDRYQNIVRAITNIFLNQSLESRVIKDTIIDSLDFSNDCVDLASERIHINEFRDRSEDIWKWYKKEKNGTVKVRMEADRVISEYVKYEALCRGIDEFCGELLFALDRDEQLLPDMADKERLLSAELERQKRLLDEEAKKYTAERDRLKQDEGDLKGFIKRLEERALYYQSINIAEINSRISHEGELHIRKQGLDKQLELLTDKSRDVKTKYDALLQSADAQLTATLNDIQSRSNQAEQQISEEKNKLADSHNAAIDELRSRNDESKNKAAEELRAAEAVLNNVKVREAKVHNTNPYEQEQAELSAKISDMNSRNNKLVETSAQIRSDIDRLTHQGEIAVKNLEAACEKDIAGIENRIADVDAELTAINELLSSYDGSLMEWLYENKPGWEDNLGLVLDEKAVLYNTDLNPQIADDSLSMMGINIDLDNIEREVRSPRELQERAKDLGERKLSLQNEIIHRREQLQSDVAEELAKPRKQLKQLRDEDIKVKSELASIPPRMARYNSELSDWNEKLQSWRTERLAELASERLEAEKRIDDAKSHRARIDAQFRKEIKAHADKLRKGKAELDKRLEDAKADFKKETQEAKLKNIEEKRDITARMDEELKGAGVDISRLDSLRRELGKVADELSYIEQHKRDYLRWLDDKEELFDHEEEKRSSLKEVRRKISELSDRYDERKLRKETEIKRITNELQNLVERRATLEVTIQKVKGFMASDSRPQNIDSIFAVETAKALAEIFDGLRDRLLNQRKREDKFRSAVNDFKANFSSANTLGFRCDISSLAEYRKFADDLRDFLANNKIEIVRARTNEMYADIIQRIAREVSDLLQHGADIRKTINDINRDFRENNFAGVIKEIELRTVESNDRIMQQLLKIKEFTDSNSQNIGELNLFSDIDNRDRVNERATDMLRVLGDLMDAESKRDKVTLADTFKLEFKVKQNDQDTNWVEKLSNVGSDGTDILVKAIVNIMLINVFKRKASARFSDFTLHCMMDEIGKLHPNNVQGILAFANARNIRLINSSPTTYNASAYRHTYALSKDAKSNTVVKSLLTIR